MNMLINHFIIASRAYSQPYAMIMFCNFHDLHVDEYGDRQEPYGSLIIIVWPTCKILTPCNCFTLSLRVAIVVVAIVAGGNHETTTSCW